MTTAPTTCERVWSRSCSPQGGFVAISAPLGYQARERALVAFDLRTLEVRWELPLPYDVHRTATAPLVVDDLVLIAAGGQLYAADRHTGALRWSAPLSAMQSAGGGLAAGDGHLVVPTLARRRRLPHGRPARHRGGTTPTDTGLVGPPSVAGHGPDRRQPRRRRRRRRRAPSRRCEAGHA